MDDNTCVVAERAWRERGYPTTHPYHRLATPTRWAPPLARSSSPHSTRGVVRAESNNADDRRRRWGFSPRSRGRNRGQPRDLPRACPAKQRQSTPPTSDLPAREPSELPMVGKTQADVVLGLPTLERTSPDYYALSFANHILVALYLWATLARRFATNRGLAYYAYSEPHGSYGRGAWLLRAGAQPKQSRQGAEQHRPPGALPQKRRADPHRAGGTVSAACSGRPCFNSETNEGAVAVDERNRAVRPGLRLPRALSRHHLFTDQPGGATDAAPRWLDPDHIVMAIAVRRVPEQHPDPLRGVCLERTLSSSIVRSRHTPRSGSVLLRDAADRRWQSRCGGVDPAPGGVGHLLAGQRRMMSG